MSEIENEVLAIKAIYGDDTFRSTEQNGIFILSLPSHSVTLRLCFPSQYPVTKPDVVGIESSGHAVPKGYGSHVLGIAKHILDKVWKEGEVCLYDMIQELESSLEAESASYVAEHEISELAESHRKNHSEDDAATAAISSNGPSPTWTISAPTTEKKSVFIARACFVSSPAKASLYVTNLFATDKKVAKATHNITAFRIRFSPSSSDDKELMYQDCDDDGETAAGGRLLHLLQVMDVWNVLVVVSRWYGGIKLGPDRFRIISSVAREVLVKSGFGQTSKTTKTTKK